MSTELSANRYGKSAVRLMKVLREGDRHRLLDVAVDIALTGDFAPAYRDGDNRAVLPTDTMKNTVYALARRHAFDEIEELGLLLASHFLTAAEAAREVTIDLAERPWSPIAAGGRPHPHAFEGSTGERRTARVTQTAAATEVSAGLRGLRVLKSADSGFAGFPRDAYTTLAETDDRVFATEITATWRYAAATTERKDADWGHLWHGVRQRLLETFAAHASRSAQHTLWAMGEAVLAAHPEVAEIHLALPNKHHLLVDLAPFGLDNPNEIFAVTDEPYGLIEGTVRRG